MDRSVDAVIIGMGYVGLPLAREASAAGLSVIGFDVNAEVVDGLNHGRSQVDDLVDSDVVEMLGRGFFATTDASQLRRARTIVVCVPTPLSGDGTPDLGPVRAAATSVAEHLQPSTLVILESTTYPGTTDEEIRPMLEAGGLVAGKDFSLVFSPERIDPGNQNFGPKNTPKVIGGHTSTCADAAEAFYSQFIDAVVRTKGTREAETAKLLENTYRHINIALVNEMARFCHDLDIDLWDVIDAASTKPFGFQAFRPGPGVGGHCIPIDPNYLSHRVRARLGYPFRFVELAQEINAAMPEYWVAHVVDRLNEQGKAARGSQVLVIGVAYKKDIGDIRESPALDVIRLLAQRGAVVRYHDPHVPILKEEDIDLKSIPLTPESLKSADCTVIVTDHAAIDYAAVARHARVVVDTRNALAKVRERGHTE